MANQYDDLAHLRWKLHEKLHGSIYVYRKSGALFLMDSPNGDRLYLDPHHIRAIEHITQFDHALYATLRDIGLNIEAALMVSLSYD